MSTTVIDAFVTELDRYKRYCDAAIAQVDAAGLHSQINPLQNSIAAIMQHIVGNMVSRWTDFLTTDGEKPGRDREAEFLDLQLPRAELMVQWENGWKCMFDTLKPLTDVDLERIVTIRNEPHTVALAIARQLAHYAWHAGQIALICKHLVGERWNHLTVPPGGSAEFNRRMDSRK